MKAAFKKNQNALIYFEDILKGGYELCFVYFD